MIYTLSLINATVKIRLQPLVARMLTTHLLLISGFAMLFGDSANAQPMNIDETIQQALSSKPDLQQGKKLYMVCAVCHTPEGWGSPSGHFPQIAGQHKTVILKQLADIHLANRDNPTMAPFASSIFKKGPQAMADLAAYIEQLPMVPNNSVGSSMSLETGKKIYDKNCKKCHDDNGEGNAEKFYPRIQGQHYQYLLRQLHWMKMGKRRNADEKMLTQIESFSSFDLSDVANYVSHMKPDKSLLSTHSDWRNPDFRPNFKTAPKNTGPQ